MADIARIKQICGDDGVIVGDDVSEKYNTDWTALAPGRAWAVARPKDTATVSALLAYCNDRNIAVVVQGGHTGMSGGATPDGSGRQLLLATERLNRVRAVDAAGRTMTVEAGCVLENVQAQARAAGLFFPLNLGARGTCQIGGNLATNAGGVNVLRYGNARDVCLGVEAVLADGRVLDLLSPLRKDNSGYDLKNLLIGSEGTLAVITAATLKLFAPPIPLLTALVAVPSVAAATKLTAQLSANTSALTAAELMPQTALALAAQVSAGAVLPAVDLDSPFTLLIEICGERDDDDSGEQAAAVLLRQSEQKNIGAVTVAQSEKQRQAFWQLREELPLHLAKHGKWKRADIAVPLPHIADLVSDLQTRLPAICAGVYILGFGHLGDGNLHISLRPHNEDPAQHPQKTQALTDAIYERVCAYGGTFSAEHGIGQFKTDTFAKYKNRTAADTMRAIKAALDPKNTLNPNRIFP